ncbi:MAG: response regulator transcription factor [Myxococcota bacterium]
MERRSKESPGLPILVVEDEESILRGLCDVLAFQGYAPEGVARGDLGLSRALDPENPPALVLLDVMLPGLNGYDVCEQLRAERPELPILMLTARGGEDDILRGFRSGADDYVTKPFSVAQLVARVEALLRRANAGHENESTEEQEEPSSPFVFGSWQVNPAERAANRDAEHIELTPRDLELMRFFAAESNRILSRRRLLMEVWGYPDPDRVETRSVDMHIAKLRKKLGSEDGARIETIRGEGYRFRS